MHGLQNGAHGARTQRVRKGRQRRTAPAAGFAGFVQCLPDKRFQRVLIGAQALRHRERVLRQPRVFEPQQRHDLLPQAVAHAVGLRVRGVLHVGKII